MYALLTNPFESVAAPLTDRPAAALTPPSPGAAATNFVLDEFTEHALFRKIKAPEDHWPYRAWPDREHRTPMPILADPSMHELITMLEGHL